MSTVFINEYVEISIEHNFIKIDFAVRETEGNITKTGFVLDIMDVSNALLELVNKTKQLEGKPSNLKTK